MSKKQKYRVTLLLLSLYTVLLGQEIHTNLVLCLKNDGTKNIELSGPNLKCTCINDHMDDHRHSHLPPDPSHSHIFYSCSCMSCIDLLIDSPWRSRILPFNSFQFEPVKIQDIGTFCIFDPGTGFYTDTFSETVPLRPIISPPRTFPLLSAALRC